MFAAAEARAAGYGGIAAVSRGTGLAASTIGRGLKELAAAGLESDRVRRHGGGRKALLVSDTKLLDDLLTLLARSERGDPMSPLRWTCKSLHPQAAASRLGRTKKFDHRHVAIPSSPPIPTKRQRGGQQDRYKAANQAGSAVYVAAPTWTSLRRTVVMLAVRPLRRDASHVRSVL